MINSSEPLEYVPRGKQMLLNLLAFDVNNPYKSNDTNELSVEYELKNNNGTSTSSKDFWILRNNKWNQEEELFYSGSLAICSKGDQAANIAQTSFCCETDIIHAIWCQFLVEDKSQISKCKVNYFEKLSRTSIDCICLLDSYTLNVFTELGEHYTSSLQFKVAAVWSTKYGILIEKSIQPMPFYGEKVPNPTKHFSIMGDSYGPTVYSLKHPLDDICPVLIKHGTSSILWDSNIRIIFTSNDPSLAFVFDSKSGIHSIYKVRKASNEECQIITANTVHTSFFSDSMFSSLLHYSNNIGFGMKSSMNKTYYSCPVSGTYSSPFHSKATSYTTTGSTNISLLSQHMSKSHSPMATISRCQSPNNPVFSTMSGASLGQTARCNKSYQPLFNASNSQLERSKSSVKKTEINSTDNLLLERAVPELCLEHIWSENFGIAKDCNGEEACKVFVTVDFIGQSYFCYLLKNLCQLYLIRLEKSNDQEQIILGILTIVNAKDVVNLTKLKMMAVMELNGNIALYSGTYFVGKLHIPTLIPNIIGNSYTLSNFFGNKLLSPYPRRSSLISPSKVSTPELKFDDGLHLLSPVGGNSSNLSIIDNSLTEITHIRFKSAVSNKLFLEYGDSVCFQITLPIIKASPLVEKCLKTLKIVLPRDIAMLLLIEWYIARNAPGPEDLTLNQEYNLFLTIFFTLFGYDVSKLNIIMITEMDSSPGHNSPIILSKKQRTINRGSADDWSYLVDSGITNQAQIILSDTLGFCKLKQILEKFIATTKQIKIFETSKIIIQSIYTSNLPYVLFSLHLLYEEIKLNSMICENLILLAKFLFQLSIDLNFCAYTQHYLSDFPILYMYNTNFKINELEVQKVSSSIFLSSNPPNILQVLYDLLAHPSISSYPHLFQVNPLSKNLINLFTKICKNNDVTILEVDQFFKIFSQQSSRDKIIVKKNYKESIQDVIIYCSQIGMDRQTLDSLPFGINYVLSTIIYQCREEPPINSPSSVYDLIDRQDLAALEEKMSDNYHIKYKELERKNNIEQNDGMEIDFSVFRLRFDTDHRVLEARKLLDSSEPVNISINQRPDVSDHEFIEEQEKFLYALCTRTMALPIGRGMFTLRTSMPINTEQLMIPRLCLTGTAPPRGTSIELTHIDVPSNMNLWPLFHNGVATGLCIHPKASNVDSTWIVYNKQQGEFGIEHSGFLMALGLNGHLKNLAPFSMYEYLVECHETTSVGLLLGLSATHRSSMDVSMTKLLSLHVETLLPPTSIELNVQQNVQVAALMGVGLVYQETNHRHIAHALLSEIGRPPGPEMKNCVDRESYSLTAGLALGLVVLCSGGKSELGTIPEKLHYYMVGGNNRPFSGVQKDKYRSPSYQIREGDSINIDVTSPGATIALGLMYLKTGNRAVAEWMTPPNTQYLLDFARPDFLLLRTLAKSLILWDEIDPSKTWISGHVPEIVAKYKLQKPFTNISDPIDLETINQAYCNIIAGACMAVGLKYAGTENFIAFRTLYHFLKMFMALGHRSVAQLAGRATIETCLNVVLLSASMVMSGSGNLEILRVCRHMRARVGSSNNVVTYGSHLAIHMSLGFLFLGGGCLTLSNSTSSIAALVISTFPKFPTHSNDNRYHLQALRHMYVLSTEPRLLIPKDIDNGKFCYTNVRLTFHSHSQKEGQKFILRAPCLLPQLSQLSKIELDDDRYWKIIFDRNRNFDQLTRILCDNNVVSVKQRAGCLSHMEDPQGFRSLLAHVLTTEDVIVWTATLKQITSFTTNATVLKFIDRFLRRGDFTNKVKCDHFCTNVLHDELTPTCSGYVKNYTNKKLCKLNEVYEISQDVSETENHFLQSLIRMTYECVVRDKINFLPLSLTIYKISSITRTQPKMNIIWQMKFLYIFTACMDYIRNSENLLNIENVYATKQKICQMMDIWETYLSQILNANGKMDGASFHFEAFDKLFCYMLNYDIAFQMNELTPQLPENPLLNKTVKCSKIYGSYRFNRLFNQKTV